MTNEEKILELLMRMQKDIVELKQDVSGLKQDVSGLKQGQECIVVSQERLEVKVNAIDAKINKVSDTQVADIYTLTQMTHDKMTKVESKLGILNNRLFDQEAEIQGLKRVK